MNRCIYFYTITHIQTQVHYIFLRYLQVFFNKNVFMISGPVVQRIVSLTSSLRVISLIVLADSINNILIFLLKKNVSSFWTAKPTHIFSAKNFSIFAYHSM